MADEIWKRRSTSTRYRFVRVSRATGYEMESLPMLKGGSIERNNDVEIYERATVERVSEFDIGADLVRVYMDAAWPGGETRSECLGTFITAAPTRSVKGSYSTASVELSGRLQELASDGFASPQVLPVGTNAVAAAADVCRQSGLEVISDPSDYVLSRARTYGIGVEQNNSEVNSTKLGMVNNLLSLAGFWSAKTDPYGRVVFRKYAEVADRPVEWQFAEGPMCDFEREADVEFDESEVANHVVVVYSSDEQTIVGEAWDTDPESRYSTVSQGRTITAQYSYTDLPEEGQAAADRYALQLLRQNQSVIHRVTVSNAYVPVKPGAGVTFRYDSAGIDAKFEVRTQDVSLVAGGRTQTELRRFVR